MELDASLIKHCSWN